ncbi:hypothetical protein FP358_18660, partial [Enterobacter hormaechei]|nr:hypothetical protein [Enterobacter hormaechei]
LHGDVLMWLMKTLLTSGCTNQRGAGHSRSVIQRRAERIMFSERLCIPSCKCDKGCLRAGKG